MLHIIAKAWYAAAASLRNFDATDTSLEIRDIRDYLSAKIDARYSIHPRVLEETVRSVFESTGYSAIATAYTNDGGVDVVLTDNRGMVAVQVKRYRSKIKVDQIRAFLGALVLGDYDRGIFVSTSEFQPGAFDAAIKAMRLGVSIDLMDGKRFLEDLGIAQMRDYVRPSARTLMSIARPQSIGGVFTS